MARTIAQVPKGHHLIRFLARNGEWLQCVVAILEERGYKQNQRKVLDVLQYRIESLKWRGQYEVQWPEECESEEDFEEELPDETEKAVLLHIFLGIEFAEDVENRRLTENRVACAQGAGIVVSEECRVTT